jgi:hypothetical protein
VVAADMPPARRAPVPPSRDRGPRPGAAEPSPAAVSIDAGRQNTYRRWVHLGLIASAVVSLVFEPVLAIHVGVGGLFVVLVATHLAQRRQVSANLVNRLLRRRSLRVRSNRMAAADLVLLTVTAAMFASGLWDWLAAPTQIRWHAITGVVLAALLLVHTVRRRRRLLSSQVR